MALNAALGAFSSPTPSMFYYAEMSILCVPPPSAQELWKYFLTDTCTPKAWLMWVLSLHDECYSLSPTFGAVTFPPLPWQTESQKEWGGPEAEAVPSQSWLLSSLLLTLGLEHVLCGADLNKLDSNRTLIPVTTVCVFYRYCPVSFSSGTREVTLTQNHCVKVMDDNLGRFYLPRDLLKGKAWMQIRDNAQDLIRNIHNTDYHLCIIYNLIYLVNN